MNPSTIPYYSFILLPYRMNENLALLRKIARETAKFIRENVNKEGMEKTVMMGAYKSPTSRIDYETESFALEIIKDETDWNVLTEERGFLDRKSEYTLVMDPVDGTYNAIHGIPYYAVSLALYRGDICEASTVINVPGNIEYYASLGGGAYRDGERISVRKLKKPYLFVVALGESSSDFSAKLVRRARRIRSMGCASLEMIMVAEGVADLFLYDHTPKKLLRIVDIAASTLIVREAGGKVVDLNNRDLAMPLKVGVKENVMAYGDERVLEVIR